MGHDHLKENSIPKAYRRDLKVNIIIQYVPVVTWISHPSNAAFTFSTKLLMVMLKRKISRLFTTCLQDHGAVLEPDARRRDPD